ncbi:MAG: hypothetical protein OXQ84_15010 [bacterium]|nr:hypothetical protein [bacterium]
MTDVPRLSMRHRLAWFAHLWKALTRQHHPELCLQVRPFFPTEGVVLDVGPGIQEGNRLFTKVLFVSRSIATEPRSS